MKKPSDATKSPQRTKGASHASGSAADDTTPPVTAPPDDNTAPLPTTGPQFAEPVSTGDPQKFVVKHGSDAAAYKILDAEKGTLKPRPFPIAPDVEPTLTLAQSIGSQGKAVEADIQKAGQIVFHAVGDTGSSKGPRSEDRVADKMVSDFDDPNPRAVPSFFYHLGDVVYSFGEAEYYYDQFYDPYRNYPAPIFAIAGNHDGMVAPNITTPTLQAFLRNFCAAGQAPHRTPEAGELSRTAQIQPGVYFTLEAPFVRILGLYSNCLEDPGVISTQNGTFPYLTDKQLDFLAAALARIKKENFKGAVLIALHHPPYVAVMAPGPNDAVATPDSTVPNPAGKHGGSSIVLQEIDAICQKAGVWPHAFLSGHAHNYQRFTRTQAGRQTPFLVAGDGGHAVSRLTRQDESTLRTPLPQPTLSNGSDTVVFENYDDQDYGYLRILADPKQLRIEYHPASDGAAAKTPDDSVTVDLASRQIIHYQAPTPG